MNLAIRRYGARWSAVNGHRIVEVEDGEYVEYSGHLAIVAALMAEIARIRDFEHVEAAGDYGPGGPIGLRIWRGPRYKIPVGFNEISNESGEPGPTWIP